MKRIFCLCLLTAIFSIAAAADVRVPDTPKPKKGLETELRISISKDAKEARLVIPKSQLKQLRAELEGLDTDSNATAFLSFSRTQTIVSGLFLSLALVFGGVWFSRSRQKDVKPNKTPAVGAVLFLVGALGTVVYANFGPPIEARSITGKIFSPAVHQYKQASGQIRVETTDKDSDSIQLIVPDVQDKKEEE